MKLFEGRRPSAYFHSGQLKKEKKTPRRFWLIKLAISMSAADAHACSASILSYFQQIEARENTVDQIQMGSFDSMTVKCFKDKAATEPELVLNKCLLTGFYMTHEDGLTELWVTLEQDLSDKLHAWVRDYAFTRFCLEFLPTPPNQLRMGESLAAKIAEGAGDPNHPLQKLADKDGTRTTLTTGDGNVLAEFRPKGKV